MFKRGDIVVYLDERGQYLRTFVVESYLASKSIGSHILHSCKMFFGFDIHSGYQFHDRIWLCTRLATQDEKDKFFEFLHSKGYRMNLNTFQLCSL
jgi:hypothetical protein